MEQIKHVVQEGNQCVYFLYIVFNIILFCVSLGILGCASYLFWYTQAANIFNIGFLSASLVLLFFSFCGFRMRKSIHLLGFYIFILTLAFIFQSVLTIVMFANPDILIQYAENSDPTIADQIDQYRDYE